MLCYLSIVLMPCCLLEFPGMGSAEEFCLPCLSTSSLPINPSSPLIFLFLSHMVLFHSVLPSNQWFASHTRSHNFTSLHLCKFHTLNSLLMSKPLQYITFHLLNHPTPTTSWPSHSYHTSCTHSSYFLKPT